MLTNALFGAIKITKYADIKKYKYSGYGIRFDSQIFYNHPSEGIARDAIICRRCNRCNNVRDVI